MLQQLNRYQKEIAINLFALFLGSVLLPYRGSAMNLSKYPPKPAHYASRNYSAPPHSGNAIGQKHNTMEPVRSKEEQTPNKSGKPTIGFIGGPGQPEMSAFKSVNADKMVDLFTGDFSYNIPLLDVGGYPVNLFYNGGITMDQQASWVGLGFNINPGTIMRNMRGLPDDFDGTDMITKTQSMKPDLTYGVNAGAGLEVFGTDQVGINVSAGLSYNNQRGIAIEYGINPSVNITSKMGDDKTAKLSFGANLNVSSQSGASISPSIGLEYGKKDATKGSLTVSLGYHSRMGLQALHLDAEIARTKTVEGIQHSGTMYSHSSSISFAYPAVTPSLRTIMTRKNYNVSLKFGPTHFGVFTHPKIGGFYSEAKIGEKDIVTKHAAYGMLYYTNANTDKKAMLDFNRLNDGVFTKTTPAIALPVYTYDVFSISGEGTGGSFRAYRGDLGYVRDEQTTTRDDAGTLGIELGGGNGFHGGFNAEYVFTPTTVGEWDKNNLAKDAFKFRETNGAYQSVYFKNPAEKTIPDQNYQDAIGGEDLVRLKMINQGTGTPALVSTFEKFNGMNSKTGDLAVDNDKTNKKRDKRIQVISTLTAEEASRVGFDRKIASYDPNPDNIIFGRCDGTGVDYIDRLSQYRKKNHISEIDVLGEDGRRYVYGIPVYNIKESDVTFSVDNSDAATELSNYEAGEDDTPENKKGKDWYMERQDMPAYTHSFLLTALVSPDYVDVKGDGITEDDKGDAIKFNYSQYKQGYKWRTPTGNEKATWSQGMKTDNLDDKGHYIYGEREMWYLYSIESKNMVARFYVVNDRKDDHQAAGPAGGIDNSWGSQRLSKISLYSKADLLKPNPKPIKTVHFEYDYTLCKNVPGSTGTTGHNGKLTLTSIYFSYNGNEKLVKNKYKFSYANNPDYDYNASDRWGNYKPRSQNPDNLSNADYSYTIQNKTTADQNAAAWMLSEITIPSGGKMTIDYEADDYAYVQDRRASTMYNIIGFGKKTNPSSGEQTNTALYTNEEEFEYIYAAIPFAITETDPVLQQRELTARYFNSKSSQLFMKLAVTMPSDARGTGEEFIPMYADIVNYGIIPGTGGTRIYIKVKRLESGHTPMVQYALQFMKNYLPFKAHPGYDLTGLSGLRSIIMAIAGWAHNLRSLIQGEDNVLMKEKKCKRVVTDHSFLRLTNPYLYKYGGGYRVKKVVLNDNWNKLSNSYDATYGQEYVYKIDEQVNGVSIPISSGVASWEPSIGGEENPHREILRYLNQNKGGPFDYSSVELPLAEMFFPAASVGYRKVEVLSIHRDNVKNAPGRAVTEYYTTKEFPTISDYTSLADGTANVLYEPKPIMKLLKLDLKQAVTVSQGFRVVLNDMNGKLKMQAAYAANDAINPISYTYNYYNVSKASDNVYRFNHSMKTLASAKGVVGESMIGRDVEIMTDFREHKQETITTNLNFNFDFVVLGGLPISIPTWLSPTYYESNTFRSAAVLKVVNHYATLDSVVVIDKGSMVSTKNLVYDGETGNPLVTRTNNESNKALYSFSYPAHWAYSGMGPAYKNIDVTYKNLVFRHGLLETSIDMSLFESGDELYVFSESSRGPLKDPVCDIVGFGTNAWLEKNNANRIWAVNTAKAGSAIPRWVFMDRDGQPYTAANVTMRIIRSGKRNLLDQGVGGVSSLNNPQREVSGTQKIVLDDATAILQATSASFKDLWKVDNAFYGKDSIVSTISTVDVLRTVYYPDSVFQAYATVTRKGGAISPFLYTFSENNLLARFRSGKVSNHYTDTWVKFDLKSNPLPTGSKILKSYFELLPHYNTTSHSFLDGSEYSHNQTFSHKNGPGPANNLIAILRMKSPWPSSGNSSLVYNLLTDPSKTLHDWNAPNYIPATTAFVSTQSYTEGNNSAIDVTNAVKDMYTDLATVGNTNATAFRLMVSRSIGLSNSNYGGTGNQEYYQCFTKGNYKLNTGLVVYSYQCDGQVVKVLQSSTSNFAQVQCFAKTKTTLCLSRFLQRKSMNPYVEGVWGNWRVDTAFVYYGERNETDPSVPVDLRSGGTIKNFKTFWNFSASITSYLTRNLSASDVWPWKTEITQYNAKGYEIENKDALGRYNAGLYGYNQQLPVAVANNSRYRQILFDGFEDYGYQSASCSENCKPRRSWNFSDLTGKIDASEHHTGRYSLRVDAGSTVTISAPVTSLAVANQLHGGVRVKIDSTAYSTTVWPPATGLSAAYLKFPVSGCSSTSQFPNCATNVLVTPGSASESISRTDALINLQRASTVPYVTFPWWDKFAVHWNGKLLVSEAGTYQFRTMSNDGIKVYIDGVSVIENWNPHSTQMNLGLATLSAGLHELTVNYYDGKGGWDDVATLEWKSPSASDFTLVPATAFYLPGTTGGTTTSGWCSKLDSVQVKGAALTDTFSLIQNTKMVVSAWVKEGSVDCKCSTYSHQSIDISFTGSGETYSFKPTGNIIEGWQRYESVFVVPATATNLLVQLKGAPASTVYFDDLRLHPFNANMKSFVYHSSSLRLLSELDENNYASFYEYDNDGTLIRTKKETERGIKTITETRSALQKAE